MDQIAIAIPSSDDRLAYSVADVCRLLGVAPATLYRILANGRLRSVRMVGRTLILRSDLNNFLAALPSRAPGCSHG
jgi:excisionase family DNA binding protein